MESLNNLPSLGLRHTRAEEELIHQHVQNTEQWKEVLGHRACETNIQRAGPGQTRHYSIMCPTANT